MKSHSFSLRCVVPSTVLALAVSLALVFGSPPASAEDSLDRAQWHHEGDIQRVLLISIDGMHALDLTNFVNTHPGSALAGLSARGVIYSNASSAMPSDSFPGLLAMLTGGSPNSTGVWYDNSYDRKLSPPLIDADGNPLGPVDCKTALGTQVLYDETIDFDPSAVDGGAGSHAGATINPARLPRDPARGCAPVYPHNYLRTNTVFEAIKSAHPHLKTAWSDKHPSYDIVRGPSGHGVDDLFTPEINNAQSPTSSVAATQAYDDTKVQAVLNWIDGKDHTGTHSLGGVPALFGMNFQAVSVGQKLPSAGYADTSGTPSIELAGALDHTDRSLGKFIDALKGRGLFESTLIIVSAKHGQSPIDRSRLRTKNTGIVAPDSIVPANLLAQATQDDSSLIWLKDQSQSASVAGMLQAQQTAAGISEIFSGEKLKLQFNDPALDSRVPDIIVQPVLGVIYTGSRKKIAEHGGFTHDDVNVALLVSNPRMQKRVVKAPVETMQIAPTILEALDVDARALHSVREEKTSALPALRLE